MQTVTLSYTVPVDTAPRFAQHVAAFFSAPPDGIQARGWTEEKAIGLLADLRVYGDHPLSRILNLWLDHPDREFTADEIAGELGVESSKSVVSWMRTFRRLSRDAGQPCVYFSGRRGMGIHADVAEVFRRVQGEPRRPMTGRP